RGRHRPEVGTAFRGLDRHAGQLPIRHPDAVLGHRPFHATHVVGADLVAESARAAVDHHAHLALAQPESGRDLLVVDLLDRLHLEEVIPRAEAAQLGQPTLDRAVADLARIGVGDRPELLASIQIPLTALALLHYVPRAAGEHPLQFATALHGPDRAFAGPARRLPGQCVHQLVADLRELRTAEVCTEQSDTARDVEADTAGRDHSPGTDVRSRHTTDREAISPMDVRHGIGGADDP